MFSFNHKMFNLKTWHKQLLREPNDESIISQRNEKKTVCWLIGSHSFVVIIKCNGLMNIYSLSNSNLGYKHNEIMNKKSSANIPQTANFPSNFHNLLNYFEIIISISIFLEVKSPKMKDDRISLHWLSFTRWNHRHRKPGK